MFYISLLVLVIPENSLKEIPRIPGVIKDTIKKLLSHKNSVKKHEEIKNVIPESAPKVHLQSLDYEGGVYIGGAQDEKKESEDAGEEEEVDEAEEEEEQEGFENQIGQDQSLRGDVFRKCHHHFCFRKKKQFDFSSKRIYSH